MIGKYSEYCNNYRYIDAFASKSGRESIKKYCVDKNIQKVIIYGAGVLGRIVADTLEMIDACKVIGVIDLSKNTNYGFSNFIELSDLNQIEYDMIVITPLSAFKAIDRDLSEAGIEKKCFALEMTDYVGRGVLYENGLLI